MNKIIKLFFLVITTLYVIVGCGKNEETKTKVSKDFIPIYSVEDYKKLIDGEYDLTKNYILMNDLDLTNYCKNNICNPIGNEDKPFSGIFDGNNHLINGWYYNYNDTKISKVGFFGKVYSGTIKNLKLQNAKVDLTETNTGSTALLVGEGINIYIDNCKVLGEISAKNDNIEYAGVIAGIISEIAAAPAWKESKPNTNIPDNIEYKEHNENRTINSYINNVHVDVKINMPEEKNTDSWSNNYSAAGFAGNATYTVISNSTAKIDATGGSSVSGFIYIANDLSIYKSSTTINAVVSNGNAYGFAYLIKNCIINETSAKGNIEGTSGAGYVHSSSSIGYADYIGIYDSYTTVNMKFNDLRGKYYTVSSFAYDAKDGLSNVYASGNIELINAEDDVKIPFVKEAPAYTAIEQIAYYNKDLITDTYVADLLHFKGLTANQMKSKKSYNTFDFDNIWDIDEGKSTPYLKWEKNIKY